MKKLLLFLAFTYSLCSFAQQNNAMWGECPQGWTDFKFGLQSDNLDIQNTRMKQAIQEGVKLDYRYVYINEGVDSLNNSLSWLFTKYENYTTGSTALGLKPAYVIYMLQEEGARTKLLQTAASVANMKLFFSSVKSVALKSKGTHPVFVIEPDTWGYYLQYGLEQNLNIDPTKELAHINDLGGWLRMAPGFT